MNRCARARKSIEGVPKLRCSFLRGTHRIELGQRTSDPLRTLAWQVAAQHTPYFQTDFPAEEFIARRAKIAQAIGPHAVAVLRGAIATGAFDVFRQDNDFYYFSGVEVPHAYLSIEGGTGRSRLYLPPADPKHQQSEGAELTTADADLACRLTGVDETCDRAELERALSGAGEIYLLQSPAEGRQACRDTLLHASRSRREDPWYGRASDEVHFAGLIADAQPGVKIRDLSPLVDQLRIVKSERELTLLRRAGQLSAPGGGRGDAGHPAARV